MEKRGISAVGLLGAALTVFTSWSCGRPQEPTVTDESRRELAELSGASREAWLMLADEPSTHLWWARDFRERGNPASTATELEKCAILFRWGATHVPTPEEKRDFLTTAQELDATALALKSEPDRAAEGFDRAVDDAYRVLGGYHTRAALHEWQEGEHARAARLLSATATEIEQRFALLHSPITTDAGEAVADARDVARKIGTPEPPTDEEVRRAIGDLELALDELVEVPVHATH